MEIENLPGTGKTSAPAATPAAAGAATPPAVGAATPPATGAAPLAWDRAGEEPAPPIDYPAAGFRRGLADLDREHGLEPLEVEGTIPEELDGTLLRAGPALFGSHGRRYRHWFDGDGAVCAFRLRGGRARGAVRLVESRGLLAERRAGRALHGGFGTRGPGLRRLLPGAKNAANTSVLLWDGRVFALWEGGRPTELTADDLRTRGESDLGGAIRAGGAFSAHPHPVPGRDALVNFGARLSRLGRPVLDLYELPRGGPARRLGTVPLAEPALVHDFMVTPGFAVFFVSPVRPRLLALLSGLTSFSGSLEWRPSQGTEVLVAPLADPAKALHFRVDPFFQWHFANGFEQGGLIVIDWIRYPDFESNAWVSSLVTGDPAPAARPGTLWRAEIDPYRRTMRSEERWSWPCEFPRVAPSVEGRAYRHLWVTSQVRPTGALRAFDRIARVDLERGTAIEASLGPGRWPSEPVVVPRPGARDETDAWVLTLVYDEATHRSHLAVLDGRDPGAGPVARAWLDHHVPHTFHGAWLPGGGAPDRGAA